MSGCAEDVAGAEAVEDSILHSVIGIEFAAARWEFGAVGERDVSLDEAADPKAREIKS